MRRLATLGIGLALLWGSATHAADTVYYIHTDALGSPVAMTDANRNVIERTQYAPYGQVLNRPEHEGPGYTGHEEDSATGLTNMQQRYDDKVIGRFLSMDPVQPDGNTGRSFNRYAYANDNPYRYTDPDGRCTGSLTGHCDSENLKVTQVSDPSPVSSLKVLGQRVAVHYNSNVSSTGRSTASTALSSAADLLNDHASDLSAGQKYTINQINAVAVTGSPKALLGETGSHTMTLSVNYIEHASAPWLASIFGHEGQHFLNVGKYTGSNLWRDEQTAGRMQLGIGRKIGYNDTEIQYLQNWIDPSNRDALQQHMEQGYSQ